MLEDDEDGSARDAQTLAHLVHCAIARSVPPAPLSAPLAALTEDQELLLRRVSDILLHVFFLSAHHDAPAQRSPSLGATPAPGQARLSRTVSTHSVAALQDFTPLPEDPESSFFLYFSGRGMPAEPSTTPPRPRSLGGGPASVRRKPRVLLFTCSFGGGHKSAANAISGYLADVAETRIVDTSKDPKFLERDLLHQAGKMFGNESLDQTYLFNQLILKRQLYTMMNFSEGLGKAIGKVTDDGRNSNLPGPNSSPEDEDSDLKKVLRGQILGFNPDLVLTVYHMHLNVVIALCEECGSLPLLHVSTDMDIKAWEIFGR